MTEPAEPTPTPAEGAPEPDGPVLWPNQDPVEDGVIADVPQDPDLFDFDDETDN